MQFSYIKIYFIPNGYALKLNWALSFFCFETGEKIVFMNRTTGSAIVNIIYVFKMQIKWRR